MSLQPNFPNVRCLGPGTSQLNFPNIAKETVKMPASTFLKSGKETREIPVWFPKTKFPKTRIHSVCLDEMMVSDQPWQKLEGLPCAHMFHAKCVQSCIRRKPECPVCKADIHASIVLH